MNKNNKNKNNKPCLMCTLLCLIVMILMSVSLYNNNFKCLDQIKYVCVSLQNLRGNLRGGELLDTSLEL